MEKVTATLRHVLTGIGAGLVGFGFANSDQITSVLGSFDGIIGGVLAIVGVGSAIYKAFRADKVQGTELTK